MNGWIKISCKSLAGLNISPTFISFYPILSFTKWSQLQEDSHWQKNVLVFSLIDVKMKRVLILRTMLSGSIRQLWIESLNMYSAYMAAASIDAMKHIWRQTFSIYSFPETHITGMNSRNNQEVGKQPARSGEESMWPISWSHTSFFSDWLKKHAIRRFIVKCFLFLEPFLWTFRMVVCLCVWKWQLTVLNTLIAAIFLNFLQD